MKKKIKEKIEAALAQVCPQAASLVPITSAVQYNVDVIVDDVMRNPRTWSLKAIADRHGISYWTVYRKQKVNPDGWHSVARSGSLMGCIANG